MRIKHLTLLLLPFLLLVLAQPGLANNKKKEKATFTDTFLTTSDSHLLLFSMLTNSFTDEMVEGVKSGIPLQFSFFLSLEGVENNWPDKDVIEMEFKHTLTYDTLKEHYNIELEEDSHRILTSQYLSDTQKLMGEINGLEIISLKELTPDNTYKLSMRAVLYKKTLPMGLHKVTPFISWWDVETDWYEIEFKY